MARTFAVWLLLLGMGLVGVDRFTDQSWEKRGGRASAPQATEDDGAAMFDGGIPLPPPR